MTSVFIDGESGTTGLRLRDRLSACEDVSLISLPHELRRDPSARADAMRRADVTVLCLPDQAAREAADIALRAGARVIDASSAHRTAPGWVYGMPELTSERAREIASAQLVSVPGCHATGFILLTAPLVRAGLIPADAFLSVTSVTGYSGGGRTMIGRYEDPARRPGDVLGEPLSYAYAQTHKHLPEMQAAAGLVRPPVFQPIVGNFRAGMLVTVPLDLSLLGLKPADIEAVWREAYADTPCVSAVPFESLLRNGSLVPSAMAGSDGLCVALSGSPERVLLTALYDNLGKGASGTALECLNLMTGAPLRRGLAL